MILVLDKIFPGLQGTKVFDELDDLINHCKHEMRLEETDTLWKELKILQEVNNREQATTSKIEKILEGVGPRARYRYWKVKAKEWIDSFPKDNRALQERLKSITSKYANRVMGVILGKMMPHWIADGPWIAQVRLMCLLPAMPVGLGPCSHCGLNIDDLGEHFTKCSRFAKGPSHYAVQAALVRSLSTVVQGKEVQVTSTPSLEAYMKPEAKVAWADQRKKQKQQKAEHPQADVKVCDPDNQTTILFDVRTCAMQVPKTLADVGQTVKMGERAKNEQYNAFYKFPQGVSFVPFTIDTHGRLGDLGVKAIKKICLRSAGGIQNALYAKYLSMVIDRVAVAHKRAIGKRIMKGIKECVGPKNDPRWGTREYHQSMG